MMLPLKEIVASIPHAVLHGGNEHAMAQKINTDSRNVVAGDVFVALKGERFDAHNFVAQVAASGALAAIVNRKIETSLPQIVVPDTLLALQQLACAWRKKFTIPVIAVTGSNGKTTVKEMLASILRAQCGEHYFATQGNLNNEIGVPLSVLSLRAQHQAAVLELGMNHPGEIVALAAMAQPTVALVNNAQREHQEFMKTVADTAHENGQVFAALGKHGVAVYPQDDECSVIWQALTRAEQRFRFSFQATSSSEVRGVFDAHTNQLSLVLDTQHLKIQLHTVGEHNARNAAAAAACAYAAGIELEKIQQGLENFSPVKGRLVSHHFECGVTVIDDTYNANPDSVRAAIEVLADVNAPQPPYTAHAYLVLGDMGEVGEQGIAFHQEIGAYAAQKNIPHFFATGELMQHAVQAYQNAGGKVGQWFENKAALTAHLEKLFSQVPKMPRAVILFKGSRFMRMEEVMKPMQARLQTATQD